MLIDWFTVIAQIVNFLILVWLLKRFLYKPILLAIDTREKGIAAQIAESSSKQEEARKEQEAFQHKSADFDQQRAALLTAATDDANVQRQKLLDETRKDGERLRSQQKESLERERVSVNREIVTRTAGEVFAIARKTLSDLASASLEERMAEVFLQRLHALSAEEKQQLVDSLKELPHVALVRSAFDLPPAMKTAIESAVNDNLASETAVQFATVPELICGIELSTHGFKVSWSVSDYSTALEKSVIETLKAEHA